MPILVICSMTRSLHSTGKLVFCDGTDTQAQDSWTSQHIIETELAKWANSVKMCHIGVQKYKKGRGGGRKFGQNPPKKKLFCLG